MRFIFAVHSQPSLVKRLTTVVPAGPTLSVQKLKVLAPFMEHLGYSGCTVNALYILNSFLCHFYDHIIFLRLQSFEILPCTDILLILIDYFDFTMYILGNFFFNLDKFHVQRSKLGRLGSSAL